MRDFLSLEYDLIPCWYEIGFDEKNIAMVIRVHEEFLAHMPKFSTLHNAEQAMKSFRFSQFNDDFNKGSFGFNHSFKYVKTENSFVEFSVPVPLLEKFNMKTCSYCQGHKKDILFGGECTFCMNTGEEKRMRICSSCNGEKKDFSGDDCRWCQGKGEEPDSYMNWEPLSAIACTCMVFFGAMFFGIEKTKITSCKLSQLISIESHVNPEMRSAPLGGTYGRGLTHWFSLNSGRKILEVEEAIAKTWEKIHGRFTDYDNMNTFAEVRWHSWFSMSCPGDRTGLIPELHADGQGKGYRFYCHNLDSSAQQLTLLAGLGALCDKVRKELQY